MLSFSYRKQLQPQMEDFQNQEPPAAFEEFHRLFVDYTPQTF
jgi:hypothetical protein